MRETSLVIMAAGLGSRYGGGIKQLERVGPNGEIIMDYSIYDAIEAGFNRVVFIIRKEIEKDFKEIIGNRVSKYIPVEYVFQEVNQVPEGCEFSKDRKKPWGTGQAVLCCKDIIHEPFVVINADDYYGKEAFVRVHDFLCEVNVQKYSYCMAGFILGNTLSDHGIVTRGICSVDENSFLDNVEETFELEQKGEQAVGRSKSGEAVAIPLDAYVSMNMWGFTPDILDELSDGFYQFLHALEAGDIKSEYLLPDVIGKMLHEKKASVRLLPTQDKWFGVTYQADKALVVASIAQLIANDKYPASILQSS